MTIPLITGAFNVSQSAINNLINQANAALAAIVQFKNLTGDVTSVAEVTTVAKIQGVTVSGTTGTTNVVFSASPTLVTPSLGTPSALVGTNITGTAASLTAGHVTTNANLTGPVTSVGNATTIATSIALPGNPTTTTQAAATNNTTIATTAYADTSALNAALAANAGNSVDNATTAALTGTYSNGVAGIGATFTVTATGVQTIDGQTVALNNLILLKDQASTFQNGIYKVTVAGALGVSPVYTRALDYDQSSDINNTGPVSIISGTVNGGAAYILTTKVTTVGTDALTYTIFTPTYAKIVQAGGALGTPSSGTLTNCTGLPVAGGGTGAATLTGLVLGNGTSAFTTVTAPAGTVVGTSDTQTLTNKRNTKRITTIVSNANPTINTDNCDCVTITAQAADIASMTTNLSGTPNNFDNLTVRILDNGTARAITWGASFIAKGVALPTTTIINKLLTVGFIYDTVTSKWGCIASAQEA